MKRLAILADFALVIGGLAPSKTAQAQQCPIAQHCFTCTYQQTIARNRAGDPRAVRLTRETARRGGSVQAAHTLQNTRDYQSILRDIRRACGCLRPGC
jgi:hypothetical protein